jgi:hypothetical protein
MTTTQVMPTQKQLVAAVQEARRTQLAADEALAKAVRATHEAIGIDAELRRAGHYLGSAERKESQAAIARATRAAAKARKALADAELSLEEAIAALD